MTSASFPFQNHMGLPFKARMDPEGKSVTLSRECVVTKKLHSETYPLEALNKWLQGQMIQIAFQGTQVSAGAREFLMSGMSPEGWRQTFPEEEQE